MQYRLICVRISESSLHAISLELWTDLVHNLTLLHGHVRVCGGEVHPHQPESGQEEIKDDKGKDDINYNLYLRADFNII